LPAGTAFAIWYFAPDRLVMTLGAGMPIDCNLLATALDSAPHLLRKSAFC
jgi:hypothetical protein